MPITSDLIVGLAFALGGVVLLSTKSSFETAIDQKFSDGHLTEKQAADKKKSRILVGAGSLFCGVALIANYLFLR